MSLFRSVATIGIYTLGSRILGFIRDMLIAMYAGAGPLTDAFIIAYRLPNFFRRMLAEGAFSAAFVPIFAGKLAAESKAEAMRFAREAASALLLVLLGITVLALLGMPWVVTAMAPGFRHDAYVFHLTIDLARFCFPYLIFVALMSLLTGVLNSFERFAPGAASPMLLNLSFIVALLAASPYTPTVAHALAYGVMASGFCQLLWMAFWCLRADCLPLPGVPRLTEDVKCLLRRMAPVAFGAGVVQVNILVDNILASTIPGAVSFLYYADRLNELPVGIIGIAIGTALLPMLSKAYRQQAHDEAIRLQNRALEMGILFSLPAMVGLILCAQPIISTLFQHGEFSSSDTHNTVQALRAFSIGLPAYIALKCLSAGFYANEDTKTPVKIGLVCVVVNLILSLSLIRFIGHMGIALATACSAWVNALLMAKVLYRRQHLQPDTRLQRNLLKLGVAALGMGVVLALSAPWYEPWFQPHVSLTVRVALLVLLIGGGCGLYFSLAIVSRALDIQSLRSLLRSRRSPPAA